jgi:hypothetical protein
VGLSDTILKGTHPGTIYAKFDSIWASCFRGEDFLTLANQKKELILVAMFVGQMERNGEIYRGPYIDAYCQV